MEGHGDADRGTVPTRSQLGLAGGERARGLGVGGVLARSRNGFCEVLVIGRCRRCEGKSGLERPVGEAGWWAIEAMLGRSPTERDSICLSRYCLGRLKLR